MDKKNRGIVFSLAVAMVCALAAIGFASCSDGKAGDAVAGAGPVWIKTGETHYDESGGLLGSYVYELDSQGNIVKITLTSPNEGIYVTTTEYSDFTPEGYPQTTVQTLEGGTAVQTNIDKTTYTLEDGHAVASKTEREGGIDTAESAFTYHANGRLESRTDRGDAGGLITLTTITYDENGFPLQGRNEATFGETGIPTVVEGIYEWSFGDGGIPTDCTVTLSNGNGSITVARYQIQCDDHGNIIQVISDQGETISEYEYARIDNPSMAAWLFANCHAL